MKRTRRRKWIFLNILIIWKNIVSILAYTHILRYIYFFFFLRESRRGNLKRSKLFVSRATVENLNEISIHGGIRVAKTVTLRVWSSTSKIDGVEFLSHRSAAERYIKSCRVYSNL